MAGNLQNARTAPARRRTGATRAAASDGEGLSEGRGAGVASPSASDPSASKYSQASLAVSFEWSHDASQWQHLREIMKCRVDGVKAS